MAGSGNIPAVTDASFQAEVIDASTSSGAGIVGRLIPPAFPAGRATATGLLGAQRHNRVEAAGPLGGNCELSRAGETVVTDAAVTVIAPENLPASMPAGASQFYARNISSLLLGMVQDGALHLDFSDEVTAATVITHDGAVVSEAVRTLLVPASAGPSTGGQA